MDKTKLSYGEPFLSEMLELISLVKQEKLVSVPDIERWVEQPFRKGEGPIAVEQLASILGQLPEVSERIETLLLSVSEGQDVSQQYKPRY